MHEYEDGTKWWYKDGNLHRLDGPAFEGVDGSKAWFKNDGLHREDGPAVERPDGDKAWWLNGEDYSFDDWLEKLNISYEDKLFLQLKYG